MTSPAIGDTSFLQDYLINTRVYGVVVPPGQPPEFLATYEIQGDQGTLLIAVAIGPEGPAGANMFAMTLINDSTDNVADLPQTLTNTIADIGKYWVIDDVDANGDIIGASLYVWYGTTWRRLMLGSPGPPGPVPIITPNMTVLPPNENSEVTEGGTPWEPTLNFSLSLPAGQQGPAAALALCPDVDFTSNPPEPGDVLGFSGTTADDGNPLWVPVSISQLIPAPFSMPESAFTSFAGISAAAAIGSFAIPPQPFPWTPIVWGHIGAFGVELSANPLMIGCQVLLGDPTTGASIGRGFGNSLGEVNIMPHYSSPGSPGTAITPDNGTAVVPANHSNPAQGTIYVNLYNDGEIGLYTFSPTDAQLFIMLVPVTDADTITPLSLPAPMGIVGSVLTFPAALAELGAALDARGSIPTVISRLGSFSGILTDRIQGALDGVVNSLGVTGTRHTFSTVLDLLTLLVEEQGV